MRFAITKRRIVRTCISATAGVLLVQLFDSARADDSGALQEVVVTATKRETNLQETPLSVQAISGSTLANLGNDAFRDYAILVPGLSFIDEGAAGPKLTLRGLSTSQYGETQSTVGIYVDEIPATDAGGAAPAFLTAFDLRLHDVDRIEVLRGPQGTLFGADSLGGTIRIITNQPDLQRASGTVESSVANTLHADGVDYDVDGMVNVPIVHDRLGARVVAYYEHNQGWIDNIGLGQNDVNDETVQGGGYRYSSPRPMGSRLLAELTYSRPNVGASQPKL